MKLRFAFLLSAVCAALLLAAFAQTPAPAPATAPSAQTPVLKVTTHLVQVNVVVHGKKNEPVTDLTKDDFTILDDNHPQKIATFAMESSRPADAKPQRLLLPQNTFTNKPEFRPSAAKAVTVILLDSLNSAFEDQVYAKKQLISFLQQLRPEDSVALYALGTRLQVLHDFTTDAASLIETVNKHKSRAATELADSQPEDPDTGSDDLDSFLAQAQQKIADMQMVNRVSTTMAALEAIANHVSVLPGRKNLIWISGGFPFHIGMDERYARPPHVHRRNGARGTRRDRGAAGDLSRGCPRAGRLSRLHGHGFRQQERAHAATGRSIEKNEGAVRLA
jgi:VWFA-related protein